MATILIPTPLRQYAAGQSTIEARGATVAEVLAALIEAHPELRRHLFNDEGRLRSFVNLYLNDEDIRYLEKEATAVAASDILTIVPAIAGGAALSLSAEEKQRYSRHILLPEVGEEGQLKLKESKVLLVGAGGLGSPLALYLAAAGVGTIGLVDYDTVDVSNLQRQVIHGTKDVGRKKLDSAEESMLDVNPLIHVAKHEAALTSGNALGIVAGYDVVADGTDNFPTRYLVNDACVLSGKPNAYGSIFRFEGQASVFATKDGPCYRCLYPEPPPPGLVPSCAEGGVLGILPGVIGLIQATEVVKLILGVGQTLAGRLLLYDALNMKFRELNLRKNPECPVCGANPSVTNLIDYHQFCGMPKEISPAEVLAKLARSEDFILIDVREPHEHAARNISQARLIPLQQLPARMAEIDRSKLVVVHCKSGMRSASACALLRDSGYPDVLNMRGGIEAWPA